MTLAITEDLLSIRDWIRWGASEFNRAKLYFGHGTDNAWDEAIMLVMGLLKQPWEALDTVIDARLTLSEKLNIQRAIERRIQERIPVAYIVGEATFAGMQFDINENVLVPRSPIAELIQNQFQPWLGKYPNNILDMCTGSGCIGIACSAEFPEAVVDLVDFSAAALEVANKNIERYQLQSRVSTIYSDLLAEVPKKQYELIVSNPPYVDEADLSSMPEEYQAEPSMGLGSGNDGLDITRRFLASVGRFLAPDGLLVVEVGNSWEALEHAYPQVPFLWPEFENGGHGVFVLSGEQVHEYF